MIASANTGDLLIVMRENKIEDLQARDPLDLEFISSSLWQLSICKATVETID